MKKPQQVAEVLVIAARFERATVCLEGRCSIQLSYATFYFIGATHLNLTVPIGIGIR